MLQNYDMIQIWFVTIFVTICNLSLFRNKTFLNNRPAGKFEVSLNVGSWQTCIHSQASCLSCHGHNYNLKLMTASVTKIYILDVAGVLHLSMIITHFEIYFRK